MGKTENYVIDLLEQLLGPAERGKRFDWAVGDPGPKTGRGQRLPFDAVWEQKAGEDASPSALRWTIDSGRQASRWQVGTNEPSVIGAGAKASRSALLHGGTLWRGTLVDGRRGTVATAHAPSWGGRDARASRALLQ